MNVTRNTKVIYILLLIFAITTTSEAKTLQWNYFYFNFHKHKYSDGSYDKVNSYSITTSSLNSDIGELGVFPFNNGDLPGSGDSTPIGIATNDQSVNGKQYSWQNDNNQQFSVIEQQDLQQDSDGDNYVVVGRSDSEHVANMFSYALGNAQASSGVCFSNASNIKQLNNNNCANPMFANGLPTNLNFFFTIELNAKINKYDSSGNLQGTDNITCESVTLAQQGDEPFGPSFMHSFLTALSAGVALDKSIGKLVATDGDDGWGSFGKATVKTAKAAKTVVGWAEAQHNPWWIGQFFPNSTNGNFSQYLTTQSGPSTQLNQSDSRVILTCNDNYILVVQQDTESYDTFEAEFVPYTLEGN